MTRRHGQMLSGSSSADDTDSTAERAAKRVVVAAAAFPDKKGAAPGIQLAFRW